MAYASLAMTSAEQGYAQIEKKMLAMSYVCKRLRVRLELTITLRAKDFISIFMGKRR